MDKQEKYDELENLTSTLNILINEINDKYYKDILEDIKKEAEEELATLEN